MGTIISTGQITLVDLTDQRTSSLILQADKSRYQIANVNESPTTYNPDWESQGNNLTITPVFFFGNDRVALNNSQIQYTINGEQINTKVDGDSEDPSNYKVFIRNGNLIIKQNISSFGSQIQQLRIVATVLAGLVDTHTGLATQNNIEATIEFVLVENGRTGQSVSKIETYYNTTISYEVPEYADPNWDQDPSKFVLSATNKYLWAYQKTYYKNNLGTEISENGSVFLAGTYGDTGATGSDGRSVYSISEEYYVSISEQSPTGGVWSTNAPTSLTINQYLWTRTAIVYKNADGSVTSPSYLPNENGALDATWNLAVKEVEESKAALKALQDDYKNLQNQIDGSIDTWYGEVDPTSSNAPETDWEDNNIKIRHNGDLYYNTKTGAAWRYVVTVDDDGKFKSATWIAITDAALTKALKEIEDIGAAVDGKMTIFYGTVNEVPAAAQEGDLWIQGEEGDQYRCIADYTSGVDKNNWTSYWVIANKSIGKVDILFYKNDSSTVAPGDEVNWETTSPEWEKGKYIWQRTRTYDRSNNIIAQSAPVCITSASRGITSIINYYLATSKSSGVTKSEDWKTDVGQAKINADKPYLWNYERVEYTYGDPDESDPTVIGRFSTDGLPGEPGRGVVSTTEYYLVNNSANEPSFEINTNGVPISSEWQTSLQTATDEKPYLWNAEVIQYSSGTIYETIPPALIGYRGVSIKKSTIYYQRTINNSAPSKPTNDNDATTKGWKITFEDVDITNKFLWSCTVTALSDGNVMVSNPAIIARYTEDGKSAVFAIVESTSRTIFTSDDASNPIILSASLMVGGSNTTQNVTYAWTKMGSDAVLGTGPTYEVTTSEVVNIATFICTIKHPTYAPNGVSDRITLQDKQDPKWVEIVSSRGDKFTNNNTATVLTAVLYDTRKGKYPDSEMNGYYFHWMKYNKEGVKQQTFNPTYASQIGQGGYFNSISIGNNEVDTKAIFTVEVLTTAPSKSN